MGIDVSQLSPWAQKQIAQKLAAQNLAKQIQEEVQEEKKRSKYNNQPAERNADGNKTIKFDSKKEAARFDELMLLLKAGKIRDLRLQPQFTLQEAYTTPEGERVRAIRYNADFSYIDTEADRLVVEDVKSKPTKTKVYAMKKKMLRDKFGITITEIE
jgi:hypothetical protein